MWFSAMCEAMAALAPRLAEEDLLIQDLTLLLLVSLPINIFFHRVKIPSTAGFLIAGILIGPHGLHWIANPESVKNLAEIGVVLLLFVIGLEFSLAHLLKNLPQVVGAGSLQIGLTAVVFYWLCNHWGGYPANQSIFLGLALALSSTAIVLKMITDRAELDTLHGRACVGVLLFQDVCVVPILLIIPVLAGNDGADVFRLGTALVKSALAVAAVFLLSRWVVPRALNAIAKTGKKEHITFLAVLVILATGWMSEKVGLTLAMGAFIAGLILSETEYHYQIILDILPLKDYFVGIFFISIGMMLDVGIFLDAVPKYLGLTAGLIVIKAVIATLAVRILKNPPRISAISGLRLAQAGEFSLFMAGLATQQGLLSGDIFQTFLIVCILSMLAAPILVQHAPEIATALFSRLRRFPAEEEHPAESRRQPLAQHVIIAGYGLGGQYLARVLKESHIPFIVLDLNPERIKRAMTENMPVLFGDATHRDILIRADIGSARMIVFTLSDHASTGHGVKLARKLNPQIHIMVRTRYAKQVEELKTGGADQVIPEEFETSIEIFSRVLREYRIPNNVIEQQIELVRMEGYAMFRGLSLSSESLRKFSTYLTASLTESAHLREDSWAVGKTVGEIDIKARTGATLIAVVRADKALANPDPGFAFQVDDILILFGSHAQLAKGLNHLQSGA
jgi:CPA2 family monovalent cation:H+ antiporter-2